MAGKIPEGEEGAMIGPRQQESAAARCREGSVFWLNGAICGSDPPRRIAPTQVGTQAGKCR